MKENKANMASKNIQRHRWIHFENFYCPMSFYLQLQVFPCIHGRYWIKESWQLASWKKEERLYRNNRNFGTWKRQGIPFPTWNRQWKDTIQYKFLSSRKALFFSPFTMHNSLCFFTLKIALIVFILKALSTLRNKMPANFWPHYFDVGRTTWKVISLVATWRKSYPAFPPSSA